MHGVGCICYPWFPVVARGLIVVGVMSQVKLNTDESPKIATDYGIRSIPTVIIFKDGAKLDTVIGAVPKDTLKKTLDKYLD